MYQYSSEVGVPFNHEHCWDILKESPKGSVVPTISTPSSRAHTSRASKRSKTYESSDTHFNVDDNDEDEEDIQEDIQEPQRLIGRNKTKRASTSNTVGSNPDEKFTRMLSEITEFKNELCFQ